MDWAHHEEEFDPEEVSIATVFLSSPRGLVFLVACGLVALAVILSVAHFKGRMDCENGLAEGVDEDEELCAVDEPSSAHAGPRAIVGCVPFSSPAGRLSTSLSVQASTGNAYLFGGEDEATLRNDLSVFASSTAEWTLDVQTTGHTPRPRCKHASVLLGDIFIVYGGECAPSDTDGQTGELDPAVYMLHVETMEWIQMNLSTDPTCTLDDDTHQATSPPARFGHTMCVWEEKQCLVVFAGQRDTKTLNDAWHLNIGDLVRPDVSVCNVAWELAADAEKNGQHSPAHRMNHAAAILGSSMYILGGVDSAGCTRLAAPGEIELLDLSAREWRTIPSTGVEPQFGEGASCHAISSRNAMVTVGTQPESPGIFNEVHLLQLNRQASCATWTRVNLTWEGDWTLIPGRRRLCAAGIDEATETLLVFGGLTDNRLLHDVLVTVSLGRDDADGAS